MDPQITFGNFRFEPATARLWENDAEVKLTRKAALVLAALLERPGAPVSKQDLFASVWRGTVVSDDALVTCIQELRKALRRRLQATHLHRDAAPPGLSLRRAGDESPTASEPAQPAPQQPQLESTAIAVLPFADMSPERDQDYLCEGLAEELIDALTHIEGLRVAARTSSFQFRGDHDLREVGAKLGVGSLLEGSVRKAGDRLRITVQLIDVATGYHKWSEKFERSAADVFAVQDEIAETVATLLRGGALNARERARCIASPPPSKPTNVSCAAGSACTTGSSRTWIEARGFYERAIALDAEYAPAWAGLATLHALLYEWWGSKDEDLQAADRASRIAMELAPELADAHLARGYTLSNLRPLRRGAPALRSRDAHQPEPVRRLLLLRARRVRGRRHREVHRAVASRQPRCGATISRARCSKRSPCASWDAHEEALACESRGSAARRAAGGAQSAKCARALSLGAGALCNDGQGERALEWVARGPRLSIPDDMAVIINWRAGARAARPERRGARPARAHVQQGLGQEGLDRQRSGLRPAARRAAIQGDDGQAAAVTQRYCRPLSAEKCSLRPLSRAMSCGRISKSNTLRFSRWCCT